MSFQITQSQKEYLLNLLEEDQKPYDYVNDEDRKTRLMTDPIISNTEKRELIAIIESIESKQIKV